MKIHPRDQETLGHYMKRFSVGYSKADIPGLLQDFPYAELLMPNVRKWLNNFESYLHLSNICQLIFISKT